MIHQCDEVSDVVLLLGITSEEGNTDSRSDGELEKSIIERQNYGAIYINFIFSKLLSRRLQSKNGRFNCLLRVVWRSHLFQNLKVALTFKLGTLIGVTFVCIVIIGAMFWYIAIDIGQFSKLLLIGCKLLKL